VSNDGHLNFQEFVDFFQKISHRPEIERLYKTYCDADLKISAKVRFAIDERIEMRANRLSQEPNLADVAHYYAC